VSKGKGEIDGGGVVLFAPEVEEAAVAEGDVLGRVDAEAGCGAVNPIGRAFEFGVVADGSFIDDAVALPVSPLSAPFLIAKGSDQPEREKDLREGLAVGHFGLGFNAVLVRVFAGADVREALVGEEGAAGVGADAQNFSPGAHVAIRSVVEDVGLEGARGLQGEAGCLDAAREGGQVFDAEFDFSFDGHGSSSEYTAGGGETVVGFAESGGSAFLHLAVLVVEGIDERLNGPGAGAPGELSGGIHADVGAWVFEQRDLFPGLVGMPAGVSAPEDEAPEERAGHNIPLQAEALAAEQGCAHGFPLRGGVGSEPSLYRRAGRMGNWKTGARNGRGRKKGDNGRVKTLRLVVDPAHIETAAAQAALKQAAEILRDGGLVALPTETVYGLGANALDAAAVGSIFAAKQRPAWDPVIVHIADEAMLTGLVKEVPEAARRLMKAFWPGPMTLLLPRTAAVPDAVTAGRPLVGVRMPAHPVAFELIWQARVPVAAPSANLFGRISPTTAAHVLEDLDGRIDAVVDAGPTEHGVESTVLDACQSPMVIYRPGAVTAAQIRAVAGAVEEFKGRGALDERPREAMPSPGVGLRHYAPKARLVVVEGVAADLEGRLAEAVRHHGKEKVGVMLPKEFGAPEGAAATFVWGRWANLEEMARGLYAGLHALDAAGCTVIVCPLPPARGIGMAIRDRLEKAGTRE